MTQPIEKWQSLRLRLVIFFGVLLSLLMVVVGLGTLSFITVTEQAFWQERQTEATESAAQQVSFFMLRALNTLNTVAVLEPDYLKTHPEFAATLMTQNLALLEITNLDARGRFIAGQARDNAILADLFTTLQANWFRTALAGKTYISDVYLSANEEPYLIIAMPTATGGVVAARLQMSLLWEVIQQIHFGKSGSAYVVNRAGVVLAHRDTTQVVRHITLDAESALTKALVMTKPTWSGRYTNMLGQRVQGMAKEIPGTMWVVVAELPQAEATERQRTALVLFVLSALLIIGGTLWATLALLQRMVLGPLEMLRTGVKQVGQGDLAQRFAVKRMDEIGVVTQAFNEMVSQLNTHEQQLAANESRLQASLQRERQLGEMKTHFMALMSHEFRTPLSVILTSNDLLERIRGVSKDDKTARYYVTIRTQVHHLTRILDEILLISQAQSVGLEFHPKLTNLKEFCLTVIQNFTSFTPTHQVLFAEIEPCDSLPLDPYLMRLALLNLLANAAKYSPTTSPIQVELLRNGTSAYIRVRDQGIGIPAADQVDLFSVFHRSSNVDYRPGLGLGLTIVKHVVERHAGEVYCESTEGVGSTFTIQLPYSHS